MQRLSSRLAIVLSACLAATSALADAALTFQIAVLDPDTVQQRPPRGDTRWIVEGPGDFSLAEQHGALSALSYTLAPGNYRITVWEVDTRAAAEHRVTLEDGESQTADLLLSPAQSRLVDAVTTRMNPP